MDVTCVSGGVRGCLLFVRWCWIGSSLFFLPHPGRGPAESAERVWPKRGSETEGRRLSALKRGRGEWLRNPSAPRDRLFPQTEPFFFCEVSFRSLEATRSSPFSKPTNSSPQFHFLFLATPSQPTGRGLSSVEGRKKRELLAHHHCTNNKNMHPTPPDTHVTSILPHNLAKHAFNGGSELILYLVVQ